jgi:hypothetical protein
MTFLIGKPKKLSKRAAKQAARSAWRAAREDFTSARRYLGYAGHTKKTRTEAEANLRRAAFLEEQAHKRYEECK